MLNFNEQADFNTRISALPSTCSQSIQINTILKQVSATKKPARNLSENIKNFDKSFGKKCHPEINIFSKDNSQASVSTIANKTIKLKLDDSFLIKGGNSTVLNISQDTLFSS